MISKLIFVLSTSIHGLTVPYHRDADGVFVLGSILNMTDVMRMSLSFSSVTMVLCDGEDSLVTTPVTDEGIVQFVNHNQTLAYGFVESEMSIMRSLPTDPVDSIALGIGPSSDFVHESDSLTFTSSNMIAGIPENEFESQYCRESTLFESPFSEIAYGDRFSGILKLRGYFGLYSQLLFGQNITSEVVAPEGPVSLLRNEIVVHEILYDSIIERIPSLGVDHRFSNCNDVRSQLPILSLKLYSGSDPVGALAFYPEDYTVKSTPPESDVCVLNLWPTARIGQGFDPFLLSGVNFRITGATIGFCETHNTSF